MGVRQLGVRGVTVRRLLAACALTVSCGEAPPDDLARRYLDDAAFRRSELVASLVRDDNDYARVRLARYESGDARSWSRLDPWNPPVAPLATADAPTPLHIDVAATGGDPDALRALGEAAFWRYPAMLASPRVEPVLRDATASARYGVRVGDVVRVTLANRVEGLAYTCATCHSDDRDGARVAGLPHAALDLGALGADTGDVADPARLRAWGAGRVDVSTDDGAEPIAIPDLRAVRFLSYLQRAGAVRRRSIVSVAIRIETLLITSHHGAVRPPREVALGLAMYLDALGAPLDARTPPTGRGAAVFASRCARCHSPPSYAGGLVAADVVGTDPSVATSPWRGTGSYRVPSLRGVRERAALMHDGSVPGLDALLDPSRPRVGHAFDEDVTDADRDALRAFLRAL